MVQPAPAEKVYKVPNLTVDSIATKLVNDQHHILLITRGRPPFQGHYAFPGGFVDYGEDPKHAVLRELKEECSIEGVEPELITVAGAPDRDPRKHVVSIVYHVKVNPDHEVKAGDDAASAVWYPITEV
jgi:8-oxo-dGTP diphosphatase